MNINVTSLIITLLLSVFSLQAQTQIDSLDRLTLPRFSYPSWSPDGAKILYESNTSGNWEVYLMDTVGLKDGGGNIIQLTNISGSDRMPAFSPDGKYIAFISDRDGDFEVFRMKIDGSEQIQLTQNELPEIHPYWSPDSKRIIFNRRVADARLYSVHTMNASGEDEKLILKDDELNSYAQISPDGKWIVFDKWHKNNQENGEIYLMDIEGQNLKRLTVNQDVYDGYPTWFPNSKSVLYSSEVEGVFKLFSTNIDTGESQQLTFGSGNDQRADISSDGRRIVFNRTIDNNVNIYVMDINQ